MLEFLFLSTPSPFSTGFHACSDAEPILDDNFGRWNPNTAEILPAERESLVETRRHVDFSNTRGRRTSERRLFCSRLFLSLRVSIIVFFVNDVPGDFLQLKNLAKD